jgi:hypothetical protein
VCRRRSRRITDCFGATKKSRSLVTKEGMKKKIDKGFSLSYWGLSYRRKFIHTLWQFPICFLLFLVLPKEGFLVGSIHISRIESVLAFFAMWIVQCVYTYLRWKRGPDEGETISGQGEDGCHENTVEDVPTKSWLQRHGLLCVSTLCGPIILGVVIVLIARTFPPDWGKPVFASMDRFMVGLFWSGAWLIAVGKFLLVAGLILGTMLIWKDGGRSRQSLLRVLVMVLGSAAGVYGCMFSMMMRNLTNHIP